MYESESKPLTWVLEDLKRILQEEKKLLVVEYHPAEVKVVSGSAVRIMYSTKTRDYLVIYPQSDKTLIAVGAKYYIYINGEWHELA